MYKMLLGALVVMLVSSCGGEGGPCLTEVASADDLLVANCHTDYSVASDATSYQFEAVVVNAENMDLDYSWVVDGISYSGKSIEITKSGALQDHDFQISLTVSDDECELTKDFTSYEIVGFIGNQVGIIGSDVDEYMDSFVGLENIEVLLYSDDVLIATEYTDPFGRFLFQQVNAGYYQVHVVVPTGLKPLPFTNSGNIAVDELGYTEEFYHSGCDVNLDVDVVLELE